MIEINPKHIAEAERLLLPNGCEFDDERKEFITNLESIDLVAVPGSGKTTALQAKLYCLSKSLPFEDGSGILVLSHTNAAVDEIKKNLSFAAPHLFSYPCAIVTVQEFVDRFLALPFYASEYKSPITSIDGARYNEAVRNYMLHRKRDYVRYVFENTDHQYNPFFLAHLYYDGTGKRVAGDVMGGPLSISLPPSWAKTEIEKKKGIMDVIFSMKNDILNQGILNYDDCYYLAKVYLQTHPEVKTYLRRRFPLVFVDETQDLKNYQLDILDELFNSSEVFFQRIGDHNQAIFANGTEGECEWKPRNIKTLANSYRLSAQIAKVVNTFMLSRTDEECAIRFVVNGVQPNSLNAAPVLALYGEENTGDQIKEFFRDLIKEAGLDKHKDASLGFNIIGWNTSYSDDDKKERNPRLEDIFLDYKHRSSARMNSRNTLSDYISYIDVSESPKEIKDELLAAVCRAISLSEARNTTFVGGREVKKHYTATSYSSKAKENKETAYLFDQVIFDCVNRLREGKKKEVYDILKNYIITKAIPLVLGDKKPAFKEFLGDVFIESFVKKEEKETSVEEIPITISTVHAAKGQTHCATMYVETAFRSKFESEWLIEVRKPTKKKPSTLKASPFFGDEYFPKTDSARKALKMLYVGFSRPKHLLCFTSKESL